MSAPNACPECHTFRTDGRPPTVHRARCTRGPDGSQLAPVAQGTYHQGVDPMPQPQQQPKALNLSRYQNNPRQRRRR